MQPSYFPAPWPANCQPQQQNGMYILYVNGQAQSGGNYQAMPQMPQQQLQLQPWFGYPPQQGFGQPPYLWPVNGGYCDPNFYQPVQYYQQPQWQPQPVLQTDFTGTHPMPVPPPGPRMPPPGYNQHSQHVAHQPQGQRKSSQPRLGTGPIVPCQTGNSMPQNRQLTRPGSGMGNRQPCSNANSRPGSSAGQINRPGSSVGQNTRPSSNLGQRNRPGSCQDPNGQDYDENDREVSSITNSSEEGQKEPPTFTDHVTIHPAGSPGPTAPAVLRPRPTKPGQNDATRCASQNLKDRPLPPLPEPNSTTSLVTAIGNIPPGVVQPKERPATPVIQVRLPERQQRQLCAPCREPAKLRPAALAVSIMSLFCAPPFLSIPAVVFACRKPVRSFVFFLCFFSLSV